MRKLQRLSAAPVLWLTGVLALTTGCGQPQGPVINVAHQSTSELSGGEDVTLSVSYEVGAPFTIQWTATAGTVVARDAQHPINSNWKAPNCIPEGAPMPVVTATITEEGGRTASAEFHFQETPLFRCVVNEGAPMSRPRVGHTATRLASGKVLVVGGVSEFVTTQTPTQASIPSVLESSAELYEPSTKTWAPTGALSQPRFDHQAHLLPSGKVLVVGGFWARAEGASEQRAATTVERYEPSTGTWTVASELGEIARVKRSVLLASGKVLLLGLEATGQPRNALYDPEANTWRPATALSSEVALDDAIRLPSGEVLAAGTRSIPGRNGSPPNTVPGAWRYDPGTDAWTPTGAMKTTEKTLDTSLSLLPSGEVLCLYRHRPQGGVLAELYRAETNTWTLTESPSSANPFRFATHPLHSGQVLFSTYSLYWKMRAFDPARKVWRLVGHLPGDLPWGMTVTPLPSGQTLLVGGQLHAGEPLSTTPQRTVWLHGPPSP
ncbi:Kelch repeat-containing protein [Archangium lipolyticum]|uniref:Kelch repeat-containing protein n=1 Tax=Archangium lipolyticum TaxID=2970465 RepID=UPI00214A383F|nr:kelch repeat-containing protein [Archangium lipolyticum]